jgi:uncharacterized protein (DUF2252 family)
VPELVPIRYGRMLVSPFTFYRGAAMIMAHDLAATPRSGLTVQCCGDSHLSNFGVFASPERALVFDVNDFDETLPGPWEWDVKRLAVSMRIAERDNGFRAKDQDQIVLDTVGRYRTAMAEFAGMKDLEVWYSRMDIESVLQDLGSQFKPQRVKRVENTLAKARTKDRQHDRVREADSRRRREGADHRSVAADRADRAARAGTRAGGAVRGASRTAAQVSRHARVRPPRAA